uniref:39S ribosomal protein L55, mitochondrial n=1 Tax=Pyxicephalus adspersus TaxID=30357 RepID=A0AAV3AJX4_PYXAD|nr:TPA: hypothetical protein GDO54_012869 [Pyxicephalus adspersus]
MYFSSARYSSLRNFLPASCQLHTTSDLQNANRVSITRSKRSTYLRTYPVLLVHQDGSTITINHQTPRRLLTMPIDITTLSEEERKARQRLRDQAKKGEKKKEKDIFTDISLDQYKKFWKKK